MKQALERACADALCECVGKLVFVKNGNPDMREPDAIYHVADSLVGIEVTSAYYNSEDAKQTGQLRRGEIQIPEAGFLKSRLPATTEQVCNPESALDRLDPVDVSRLYPVEIKDVGNLRGPALSPASPGMSCTT